MTATLLVSLLALAGPAPSQTCDEVSASEIDRCAAERLDTARAGLARYLAAARQRLSGERPELLARFDAAQQAWENYVDAQCGALYAYWHDGSIRTLMALNCRTSLTRERTHVIWAHWLTYADNSTPILPEPIRD